MHRQARRIAAFFERHDAWLTPTLAQPPRPIGHFDIRSNDVDAWLSRHVRLHPSSLTPSTPRPARGLVPLYWNDDGLPIGVQFAARQGDEALLFRLAAQLERARSWFDRRPPMASA
jgi:Asp-tRNA(Asn)/Glu-tRNA(Gln) amidotransferase A subunit family amidase